MVCKKLKALKAPLKKLNRNAFSHISERVRVAQQDFSEAVNLSMQSPLSAELKINVKQKQAHANFLQEVERQFFAQKLKNNHLLQADRSTKYFHS